MDDLEEKERGIDDLIYPKNKALTDLWREKWAREFIVSERGKSSKNSRGGDRIP